MENGTNKHVKVFCRLREIEKWIKNILHLGTSSYGCCNLPYLNLHHKTQEHSNEKGSNYNWEQGPKKSKIQDTLLTFLFPYVRKPPISHAL